MASEEPCGNVYVYTDESGNTGNNLFDPNQPELWTCSLISTDNIDVVAHNAVEKWRKSVQPENLHATSLGFTGIEKLADDICRLIARFNISFFFVQIDKSFHAALKFFDTVFDSGLNKAMHPAHYQMRAFRTPLVQIVCENIDTKHRKVFWATLLNPEAESLQMVAKHVKSNLERTKSGIAQAALIPALEWAIKNPLPLIETLDRKGESPNFVAFTKVIYHLQDTIGNRKVLADFVHHQQAQYESRMKNAYGALSKYHLKGDFFSMLPKVDLLKDFPAKVVFKSTEESAGLTVVDIVLWLTKRHRGLSPDKFPGCATLAATIEKVATIERFTHAGLKSEVAGIEEQMKQLKSYIQNPD